MNTLLREMQNTSNICRTENGALSHKSTNYKVYDLFAFGGSYRHRSDEDCILLFKNAYEEDAELALKCLFYLRDIRGGQGERRFFRVCFHWLANEHPEAARRNLENVSEYGRFDDLYCLVGTKLEKEMFDYLKHKVAEGLQIIGAIK